MCEAISAPVMSSSPCWKGKDSNIYVGGQT